MVNVVTVTQKLAPLALMKFFPADDLARVALVRMVCDMIETEDQAEWLANRMVQCYREWPGPYEMRACFCGRYKPKDGINAYSEVYADGFPPDPTAPPRAQITGTAPKRLEAGEPMTADPELQAKLEKAVEKVTTPPAMSVSTKFAEMLREVETPPHLRPEPEQPVNVNFKPVTQADIDRAIEEYRAKKREAEDAA